MKKIIALLLASLMVLGLFAGCGNTEEPDATNAPAQQDPVNPDTPATDASQETVNIVWHRTNWISNTDEKMVEDAINAYIEPLIGVTVTMLNDVDVQLDLELAAGGDIDLFWTASWSGGHGYQANGAAMDLTDLVKQYPALYESMPENIWAGSTYNSRNYYVPVYKEAAASQGLCINTALVDKYGWDLSTVKTFADLEPMLAEMAADGVEYPIYLQGAFYTSSWGQSDFEPINEFFGVKLDDPDEVVFIQESEEYAEYVNLVYGWNQNGYINQNETVSDYEGSSTDNFKEKVRNGEVGFVGWAMTPDSEGNASNRYGCPMSIIQISDPLLKNGGTFGSAWMLNAKTTKADACMKFLELLYTDPVVADLACFGIEGTHYNLVDGRVELISGSGYATSGVWITTNVKAPTLMVGEADDKKQQYDDFNNGAEVSPLFGFTFDQTAVDAELAAMSAVKEEWGIMIEKGFYEPEELAGYIAALKAAGADTVMAEIQAQYEAWKAAK